MFRQVLRVACVYELLLLHPCDISVCVSGVNKLITVSLKQISLLDLMFSVSDWTIRFDLNWVIFRLLNNFIIKKTY